MALALAFCAFQEQYNCSIYCPQIYLEESRYWIQTAAKLPAAEIAKTWNFSRKWGSGFVCAGGARTNKTTFLHFLEKFQNYTDHFSGPALEIDRWNAMD